MAANNGNGTGRIQDLAWRTGGPQGSGIDTAAIIFQRSCGLAGLHLYGRREYYSNIMGRHSYYDVRTSEAPKTAHRDSIDILTTFDPETIARHANAIDNGGALLYAKSDADTDLERCGYLDRRYQDDLAALLEDKDLPASTTGVIEEARLRGVQCYEVDYEQIINDLADTLEIEYKVAARTRNTLAVAISTALLDFKRDYVKQALEKVWPGRQKIVDLNVEAVEHAYNYARENFDASEFSSRLRPAENDEERVILNGSQAVALGKLAGGLTFQSYYPISPATDESTFLEAHEEFDTRDGDTANVLVVQTEDEISAVTMAAGGALTGARSSTATSGPGFALMCEGLGWASINEVPLVITLWQRGSPSTGMPTRTEQGDLRIATAGAHGDFPLMVVASGDLVDAFYDAAECFNYADRYQTVVVHMLDKGLSSQSRTLPYFDLEKVKIERGEIAEPRGDGHEDGPFRRFAVTDSGVSPRTLLGQEGNAHWMTGGEHTEEGRVTEDPVVREAQMEKRMRKMELAAREIPLDEKIQIYGDRDADLTLLSWGTNKGAILEALEELEEAGVAARFLQVRLLLPFPAEELEELLETASPLVIVESNFSGQFANLLRQNTGIRPDHLVVKYNGRPISAEELLRALESIREGDGEPRMVLRNPNQ